VIPQQEKQSSSQSMRKTDSSLGLRVGEWVEVRSAAEILATLDDRQCIDGLPFMPEMLQYCGRKFRVYKSAHKTADTFDLFTIRRMADAVHLEELRCDGAAHGGCQAGCLLFWKESWLKRVPRGSSGPGSTGRESGSSTGNGGCPVNQDALVRAARYPVAEGEPERHRCQATEMLNATTWVRRRGRWDPRFYVRDLTSGNVSLVDFIRFGALACLNSFLLCWFGFRYPRLRGLAGNQTPTQELNLQPGELVRVKSKDEIQRTLNRGFRNRGLWFDWEMLPYCGRGPLRVLRRVEKIVNEKTGEMVRLKNPCIIMEGVTCSGNYLDRRMFSQRHEYMYFREIWLERFNGDKAHPATPERS
jgi:hypothetical protein